MTTLHHPLQISSRLLPAIKVGETWISAEIYDYTKEGRGIVRFTFDFPDGKTLRDDNMTTGRFGFDVREIFSALTSFLSAAAESYMSQGENSDLFTPEIVEWAYMHSDEIETIAIELEED